MADRTTSRSLSAREAVDAIRGPLTNAEIMETYRISPAGFGDLLKQLFEKKMISEEDLSRRGIKFKVVKKPSAPEPVQVEPQPQEPSEVAQLAVIPPPPVEHDEEFLDTVTLTELLSFKPTAPPAAAKESAEIPGPEETKEEPEQKKGKFSLTGLFKKAK